MRDLDELYAFKHSIVDGLYIQTADDNYVTARWCFYTDLDIDFFWLAAHCLEKYLKAALLLNERPAKTYGHNIEDLYADVVSLAPELLPAKLKVPEDLPPTVFSLGEEQTEAFIKRLYFYGQPDNRYQFIGYIRRGSDIVKFDQLVFAVRRLCQPLESHFLGNKFKDKPNVPQMTVREVLSEDDRASGNLYSNLEKVISGERGRLLRRVLLNWNFPFAPPDFRHGRMSYGHRALNPVLVRRFLDPLDAGTPRGDKHADDLWRWANENMYLPKEFIRTFEEARMERKKQAKGRQQNPTQQSSPS